MTRAVNETRIEAALTTLNNFYVREYLDPVTLDLRVRSRVQRLVAARILDLLDRLA